MDVYIVRHGIAEDMSRSGQDKDRALTEDGKQRMKEAARGFRHLEAEVGRVFTSPLVRARQTAEILASQIKRKVEEMKELAPGNDPASVCKQLKALGKVPSVMLVGHEPNCSDLVSYLLDTPHAVETDFKKGAICLVETDSLDAGSGRLIWHLPPKVLRLIKAKP
jgi:phosphohistidine phosphatase